MAMSLEQANYCDNLKTGNVEVAIPSESALSYKELAEYHMHVLREEITPYGQLTLPEMSMDRMVANVTAVTSMIAVNDIIYEMINS